MNLILLENDELGRPLSRLDARAVHLLKTLHKKAGDSFDAGILGGPVGQGVIEAVKPTGIVFSLKADKDPPERTPLRLGVGFPRPIQLRRLLRDMANLGVEAVDLFGTELGEKSYRDTKLLKDGGARASMLEGAAQARDTIVPRLDSFENLDTWLRERPWESAGRGQSGFRPPQRAPLLAAADNVRAEGSFSALGPLRSPGGAAVLAVGSERGWSDRERGLLEEAGFVRLSMGKRALRTETACTAAAVLLMEKMGLL